MRRRRVGARSGWCPGAGARLAAVLCAALLLSPAIAGAQGSGPKDRGAAGTAEEAAWQAASWLATIPYGAAKMGVALLGGLVGGVGYVLSGGDLESSQQIWESSLSGTYVLSPDHLRGERPVVFFVLPEGPARDTQP